MRLQEFLEGRAGKITAVACAVIALVAVIIVFRNVATPSAVREANTRVFIDATTGKGFDHQLRVGESYPLRAPSGKDTGYPAELCYWTADGKPKQDPTPVLMNTWVGKPEPTFCPDCHRLVVPHNPHATADRKPPPTEAEYSARPKRGTDAPPERG